MLNLIAKIVFSGVNGVAMIPILIWTVCTIIGQADETTEIFRKV